MIRLTLLRRSAAILLIAALALTACSNDAADTSAEPDEIVEGTDSDEVAGATDSDEVAGATDSGEVIEGSCPEPGHTSPRTLTFAVAPLMCIDPSQTFIAVFDTSEGEVRVTLDTTNTPITANNFIALARWGYYDGTTWFRTDPSIDIIQGGAPNTESPADPGPGYTIPDEPAFDEVDGQLIGPYRYEPGQLVMARARGRNSSSAQYFFSAGANTALLNGQGTYVVFGQTDDVGLTVLQAVLGLHEPGGPFGGAPSRTVTVNSVRIETA